MRWLLWLIALVTAVENVYGCDAGALAVAQKLHALKWVAVDIARADDHLTAAAVLDGPLERQHFDGVTYLVRTKENCRVALQFQMSQNRTHLTKLTFEQVYASAGDAELARMSFIVGLRASGIALTHADRFEYRWRSRDSRERYQLVSTNRAEDDGRYRLYVGLTHMAASPSEVDDLPFEKGYMGCPDSSER